MPNECQHVWEKLPKGHDSLRHGRACVVIVTKKCIKCNKIDEYEKDVS